jgi:hypothetical protein|tara:strand:+ start:611 stop:1453 length:843 start_codon:yes stop_codon:yes gene_type:complete
MINVCLIKPKNYIHYLALQELAELIHFSVLELGLKSQITFNYCDNNPSTKNIVLGAHLLNDNLIEDIPENTIIFNTEQIESITENWKKKILNLARKNIIFWDYSQYNLDYLSKTINIKGKLFQIGYQKELNRINHNIDKNIDVLFYGSINARREHIINKLKDRKINVKTLFGVYGKERDDLIAKSKLILNMHMYDSKIFEIVRVFYLLSNSIPVLTEVGSDTKFNNDFLDLICKSTYENIEKNIIYLLENDKKRIELGENGLNAIKKFPQIKFTEQILNT